MLATEIKAYSVIHPADMLHVFSPPHPKHPEYISLSSHL